MSVQQIEITNVLASGTAFGITAAAMPDAVFIPGRVAESMPLVVGAVIGAVLVPNNGAPDKAPWLAAKLILPKLHDAIVSDFCLSLVHDILRYGGITSGRSAHAQIRKHLGENDISLPEVDMALDHFYSQGVCVRLTMTHTASATPQHWFSCVPQEVAARLNTKETPT